MPKCGCVRSIAAGRLTRLGAHKGLSRRNNTQPSNRESGEGDEGMERPGGGSRKTKAGPFWN